MSDEKVEEPVVRPFERADLEAVAEIMTVSFDDKVNHLTDLPHEVARDLMVEAGPVCAPVALRMPETPAPSKPACLALCRGQLR